MEKHCCSLCRSPLREDVKVTLQQRGNLDIETRPCTKCNLLHDEGGHAISMEGELMFLAIDEQMLADLLLGGEKEVDGEDIVKGYTM